MSERTYIFAVTFFTLLGLIASALMAYQCLAWQPHWLMAIVIGLGIPIAGIIISVNSRNWVISFLGYLMVVIPLGALCGPTVALYKTDVVINALLMTIGVSTIMSIIGIIYPGSLQHWSKYLFAGLLVLLAGRLLEVFFAPIVDVTAAVPWWVSILDYGGAILFTCYIMFDWNRALELDYTLDNAVDVSVAIYLDIVNLFLHLLRIFGRSDD